MKDRAAIESLIDRWVTTQNFIGKDVLSLKIELLALTLEKLKHARQQKGERSRSRNLSSQRSLRTPTS